MKKIFGFLIFCVCIAGCATLYRPKLGTPLVEYFDADFHRIKDSNKMTYYRVITYQAPNTPRGIIKDYYKSGKLQSEFYATYIDYNYDTKNRYEGEAKWYYPNGITSQIAHFKDGKLEGIVAGFRSSGDTLEIQEWKNQQLLKRTGYSLQGKAIPQATRYQKVIVYPESYNTGSIDSWGIAAHLQRLFLADEYQVLPVNASTADKLTLHCFIHHVLVDGQFTHELQVTLKNYNNQVIYFKTVTCGLLVNIGSEAYRFMGVQQFIPSLDLETAEIESKPSKPTVSLSNASVSKPSAPAQKALTNASELEYAKKACVACAGQGQSKCATCNGTKALTCSTCGGDGKIQCSDCSGRGVKQVQKQVQVLEQVPEEVSESYYDSYERRYKYRYVTKYVYKYVYRYKYVDETCSQCYGRGQNKCSSYDCNAGRKRCTNYSCKDGLSRCTVCSGTGMVTDYNQLIQKKN